MLPSAPAMLRANGMEEMAEEPKWERRKSASPNVMIKMNARRRRWRRKKEDKLLFIRCA